MKRFIGMSGGQYGDLVINTVAIKQLKKLYPDCHFTLGISKKYESIAPLFYNNYLVNDIHIYEGYDDWPTKNDIEYLQEQKFDGVFNPMPQHTSLDWYNRINYGAESCLSQGLGVPEDLQCYLNPWFGKDDGYNKYVSISAFSSGKQFDKSLSLEKWSIITKAINKMGYKCIQLGGRYDLQIPKVEKPDLDWVLTAKILYSSKLQVTVDTSWAWIGSAYQHNVVGVYGCNYSNMINPFSHLPINPNAVYLWRKNIVDIPMEDILYNIEEKLK